MILKETQIIIPEEKILAYLLVLKEKNDKSKFLLSLGYTNKNWQELLKDIKHIAMHNEIVFERTSEFGDLYSIKGNLKLSLVVTIWLRQIDKDTYRFITLYPNE